MDALDIEILDILQKDARISNADLARKVNLAPSAVLARVKKLQETGVIGSFEARVNHRAIGLKLTAFMEIATDEGIGVGCTIGQKLAEFPEVQEVHSVAGKFCYLIKVRVKDTDALYDLMKKIGQIEGTKTSETTLVLESLKETLSLDLNVCDK